MTHTLNNYKLDGPLQPLGNQLIVKLNKVDEATDSGLVLASSQDLKSKEGVVVAAGPGKIDVESGELVANVFKPGDVVTFTDYHGERVTYDGEKHLFLTADEVLGKYGGGHPVASEFEPGLDRVLVAKAEVVTETSSGIAIAASADDESNQGEVVAVGPGKVAIKGDVLAPTVSTGDQVIFPTNTGMELTFEGKKYVLVSASQCLAKW